MEASYAQVLWKLVESGMTPAKAVAAVHASLLSAGRAELLPRVARAFERLADREAKKSDVVLTIAREKDERHAHAEVKAILADMGIDTKDLKTQVDDTLVGGWRLEGRGTLIDASYKNRLIQLYDRVTST